MTPPTPTPTEALRQLEVQKRRYYAAAMNTEDSSLADVYISLWQAYAQCIGRLRSYMKTEPNTISSFTGKNFFLSNFYLAPVIYEGLVYQTAEAAYQAAKTLDLKTREEFQLIRSPGQAKRKGHTVTLRKDWDQIKIPVMMSILRSKFMKPELAQMLLDTGDADLIEGNTWGDTFWGMVGEEGENHLGILLMELRTEILLEKVLG